MCVCLSAGLECDHDKQPALPTWQQILISAFHDAPKRLCHQFSRYLDFGKGGLINITKRQCNQYVSVLM